MVMRWVGQYTLMVVPLRKTLSIIMVVPTVLLTTLVIKLIIRPQKLLLMLGYQIEVTPPLIHFPKVKVMKITKHI